VKLVYSISTTELRGVWEYQTDDEHKPRWVCSNCGKIVHKDPHDKRYCSNCGCAIRKDR